MEFKTLKIDTGFFNEPMVFDISEPIVNFEYGTRDRIVSFTISTPLGDGEFRELIEYDRDGYVTVFTGELMDQHAAEELCDLFDLTRADPDNHDPDSLVIPNLIGEAVGLLLMDTWETVDDVTEISL